MGENVAGMGKKGVDLNTMTCLVPDFAQCLQKTREVERSIWWRLATSDGESFSDLQGSPINGIVMEALKEFFKENKDLEVGVIPFYVKNLLPITSEAHNSGCHTLAEALRWAETQDCLPAAEVPSPLQAISREYLLEALRMTSVSSVGARVCFGTDRATTRTLLCPGFDRWSVEVFLRHFKLQFSLIGTDELLWCDFRDPVQLALSDWLLASPKNRLAQRSRFLRTAFDFTDLPTGKHQSLDGENEKEGANQIAICCAEMGIALPTTQRFLQLYGMKGKDAYNAARRCLRRSQPHRSPLYLPYAKRGEVLVQICKVLMNRALDGAYTTTTLIEAFIWASLASVQIVRVGPVRDYEGFWITWLEKRMQGYLRALVNYCGADDTCSAKNNAMGAKSDYVAV